ncbi:hypothetical protein LZK73_18265 [Neorhizobium galegae]|nr:hypothetical protein LZK73_18265 [Neorhizobium galegae]
MGIPKNWDHKDATNPFTFMIELVREDDTVKEALAGADNVHAAQAAYRALPDRYQESDILRLRQGARIMARTRGTGEEHRAFMKRMYGTGDAPKS